MQRQTRLKAWAALWLTLALFASLRCGASKDQKDNANSGVTNVPADWDGNSDWNGSAMEAVDE